LEKREIPRFHHDDVGSFWFQAEVQKGAETWRSAGLDANDNRGLSPKVFRVSIRDGEGYLGYLTSFHNVPGLFGSIPYQSNNYIGVDCADVLVAAHSKWKNVSNEKDYNVAMLVTEWQRVASFNLVRGNPDAEVKWGEIIHPGDFIAVRYNGARQYQHIGALQSDANNNGFLDGEDLVIHAGPVPLHSSRLNNGNFDGHVVIIRP